METSKKILIVSYAAAAILSTFVIAGTVLGWEISNLTIVTSASWVEVSVHTAVYSKKATAENKLKIAYGMIQNLSKDEKFEPDIIVQLFDGVTREV